MVRSWHDQAREERRACNRPEFSINIGLARVLALKHFWREDPIVGPFTLTVHLSMTNGPAIQRHFKTNEAAHSQYVLPSP
jgi:hypothetical protein